MYQSLSLSTLHITKILQFKEGHANNTLTNKISCIVLKKFE